MSEQTIALLLSVACVAILVGWVPCLDRLMRYQPGGKGRRQFRRSPLPRRLVTDQEVQELLRRRPFLPYGDASTNGRPVPHPASFQRIEDAQQTSASELG